MEGRLIVENFGPIKKVDIQLNKLMVLIGPQSGGKSTVAKLLTVIRELKSFSLAPQSTKKLIHEFKEKLNWYNINWPLKDTTISFVDDSIRFYFQNNKISLEDKSVDYADYSYFLRRFSVIRKLYSLQGKRMSKDKTVERLSELLRSIINYTNIILSDKGLLSRKDLSEITFINKESKIFMLELEDDSDIKIDEILGLTSKAISTFNRIMFVNRQVYIPAERVFAAIASEVSFSLQQNEIPIAEFIVDFISEFELSRRKNSTFKIKDLGIIYHFENGQDFISDGNNYTISLKEGSSGQQTMLPLLLVVYNYSSTKNVKNNFIVEEPELNLYPITQKQLVDFLGERCVNDKNSLLVTTHSPYILSAFANLIKANEVAKLSEEKKAKIKKVVPEKYWIDYNDTSAYFIDKGVSKNIMDKKFKTIDFSQIDKASDVIGNEFDKLLTIEFEE